MKEITAQPKNKQWFSKDGVIIPVQDAEIFIGGDLDSEDDYEWESLDSGSMPDTSTVYF